MKTGTLTREAAICARCEFRDDCKNKKLEACAYNVAGPIAATATTDVATPLAAELLVKHDYRNVKVAEGTTITIDLEELKAQLKRSHNPFYKQIEQQYLNYGA